MLMIEMDVQQKEQQAGATPGPGPKADLCGFRLYHSQRSIGTLHCAHAVCDRFADRVA